MKRILLLSTFFGLLTFQLFAQPKEDKIRELLFLMNSEKLIAAMLENMTAVSNYTGRKTKDPAKDSIMKAFVREEVLVMSKNWMDKDMVAVYDKYFTVEEIQKYIVFYKTTEGKKMLEVMPAIQKDFVTNVMQRDMPAFREKVKKKTEELYN